MNEELTLPLNTVVDINNDVCVIIIIIIEVEVEVEVEVVF